MDVQSSHRVVVFVRWIHPTPILSFLQLIRDAFPWKWGIPKFRLSLKMKSKVNLLRGTIRDFSHQFKEIFSPFPLYIYIYILYTYIHAYKRTSICIHTFPLIYRPKSPSALKSRAVRVGQRGAQIAFRYVSLWPSV